MEISHVLQGAKKSRIEKQKKDSWADAKYELVFLSIIRKTLPIKGQEQFLDGQLSLITVIIVIRDEIMTSKMNFEGVDETECDQNVNMYF